jgi:hypothetical protein
MPHKGFYTQGICTLLAEEPTLDAVADSLHEFEIVKRVAPVGQWPFGGPSVIIPYRPDVNGFVSVDIVNHPWPDHMGDPENESTLFGAWSMGHFGPSAYPGNLARAAAQSWEWPEGESVPGRHSAFVRIRSSYVFGHVEDDAPVLPDDYESFEELLFVTKIANALLSLPGTICYFNPNGEVLQNAEGIEGLLQRYLATGLPPLEAWSNVRLFNLEECEPWVVMDTVGMSQLDVSDHEAAFEHGRYDMAEVANFLRNAANYILENGPVIENGDTMDGPGGVHWQGVAFEQPVSDPPREVLRWLPRDDSAPPQNLLGNV